MNTQMLARLVLCGFAVVFELAAQGEDPRLLQQVIEVKVALETDRVALRQYTWTEHTEVVIKGDVKRSTDAICRYDGWGELQRKPVGEVKPDETPQAMSKRPLNRKKAETSDYVERAVSLVHTYLPPKPEQMKYLMENGKASLGQAGPGKAEIRFTRYFKEGDSITYTYDPQSKRLLSVFVKSYLATEKDPVTLNAVFESLPDGTNHLASTELNGTAKKIQVKTRNSSYQKLAAQ